MAAVRCLGAALLAAALIAAALPAAEAHAGHFHMYPDTPSGMNYVRYEIGNATTFVTLNATSNITMTGKVTLWLYAYKNCSNTIASALEFSTTIRQNGQLLLDYDTDGYAYTGPCSAPGEWYKQVAAAGTNGSNLIFWKEAATNATTGEFAGNAANAFVVRSIAPDGTLETPNIIKSVIVSTPAYGNTVCADLTLYPKPTLETLLSQPGVAVCYPSPPRPPLPSPPLPPLPPSRPPPPPTPGAAGAARLSVASVLGLAALMVLLL